MPVQHTVTVPCRDIGFRDRFVSLGRIRRGISIQLPAEVNAIFDLAQAEQLHQALGAAIVEVRREVDSAARS